MPRYEGVAHVQWELPFPLRLPPENFLCWEPEERTATFVSSPGVGTLRWSRSSTLLRPADVFKDAGSGTLTFPTADYRITSKFESGREVVTAELTCGPDGGFQEPRPYSVANVFLCLRSSGGNWAENTIERATNVLNNIIDLYRFITLDPLARSIDGKRDTYYTLVSLAAVPSHWPDGTARDILLRMSELRFGETIGGNRIHRIGANSYEDLMSGAALKDEQIELFGRLAKQKHELDVFHVLILSAIRRLKRFEWALAVLDAQSAFEVLVATVLSDVLRRRGLSSDEIENQFAWGGKFDSLQKRLIEIDKVASAEATASGDLIRSFIGSPAEAAWRRDLFSLRHRVVHEGLREVSFDGAKRAVSTGLRAAYAVQDLRPSFNRQLIWAGEVLDIPHIKQSAGRLSRIFEA